MASHFLDKSESVYINAVQFAQFSQYENVRRMDMPTHMLQNPEQYILKCEREIRKMSMD